MIVDGEGGALEKIQKGESITLTFSPVFVSWR